MAERRGPSLMNQRTLAVEPDPRPPEAPPEKAAEPPPPEPPPESPPRTYGPVVSSSDGLWERKLQWWRTRHRMEAARAPPPDPASRE